MRTAAGPGAGERPEGAALGLLAAWALLACLWLLLAFAPAQGSLAWVASAQAACFGRLDNGLPSPWGWAVLILAPLSLLAGLLGAYARELGAWARAWRAGGISWIAAMALLCLMAGTGAWAWQRVRTAQAAEAAVFADPAAGPLPEGYPRTALAVPDFSLVDQTGKPFRRSDLAGGPALLTFAYAHCATVCPFLVRDSLAGVRAVPGAHAVFLTLDPWRDTPGALPGLAQRFGMGQESRLLSGEPAQLQALLKGLQVETSRNELTGEIGHPPLVYVLDRQGRIAYRFLRPSSRWLSEALRRLQTEG